MQWILVIFPSLSLFVGHLSQAFTDLKHQPNNHTLCFGLVVNSFSLTNSSRLNGALCTFAIGSNDIWKLIWGRRMLEDFIPKDICGVKMNVLSLWSLFRSGSRMMRQYWFVSHHKNFPVILSFHLAHQPWVIKIDRTLRLNDLTDVNFPNPDLMNGSDFLDHEFPKHMPDRRVECRTPAVASVKGARTATRQGGKRVSQIGAESRTRKLASR